MNRMSRLRCDEFRRFTPWICQLCRPASRGPRQAPAFLVSRSVSSSSTKAQDASVAPSMQKMSDVYKMRNRTTLCAMPF